MIDIFPEAAAKFERLQWDYLAYSFRKGQYHRRLRGSLLLLYVSQEKIGGGRLSSVYRVLVHSTHQDLVQGTNSKVRHSILSHSFEVS